MSDTLQDVHRHKGRRDLNALARRLESQRFAGYAYSYPHKSAYRAFDPPRRLADIWREEQRTACLYLHVPFCEMRCGFCNLLTSANPKQDVVERFLAALSRQLAVIRAEIGARHYASFTIGGGTPTFLSARQLAKLLENVHESLGVQAGRTPFHIETSPATATRERLRVLVDHGVNRISIGAQSFEQDEVKAMGRPQKAAALIGALDEIRRQPLACLNIDLMYGAMGQTEASFERSIERALHWQPEEIFLYPLYVRSKTGLDGRFSVEDRHRLALYRHGRAYLLGRSYEQISMRMFRKIEATHTHGSCGGESGDAHRPLVGVGCGARSRTAFLHYSSMYAVSRVGVAGIIDEYCRANEERFAVAEFGVALNSDEQKRRAIVNDILVKRGLDNDWFANRFGESAETAVPLLADLEELGLLERAGRRIVPTILGFEYADAIGPAIYSPEFATRMQEFRPA